MQSRISQIPATKRWGQAIEGANGLLELVQQEMQDYHDQRSESWQEGERAEAFQERLNAITEAIEALQGLRM